MLCSILRSWINELKLKLSFYKLLYCTHLIRCYFSLTTSFDNYYFPSRLIQIFTYILAHVSSFICMFCFPLPSFSFFCFFPCEQGSELTINVVFFCAGGTAEHCAVRQQPAGREEPGGLGRPDGWGAAAAGQRPPACPPGECPPLCRGHCPAGDPHRVILQHM